MSSTHQKKKKKKDLKEECLSYKLFVVVFIICNLVFVYFYSMFILTKPKVQNEAQNDDC